MPSEIARVDLIWTPSASWSGELAVCGFWVHHHHITANTFSWDTDLQGLSDGVNERLVSHWGTLSSMFGSGFKISEIRAAQIGTDGKEINAKTTAADSSLVGSASGGILPPEVALAVSFYSFVPGTFQSKPGQRRGRMYLPYLAATMVDNNGKLALPQAKVDAWTAFFNDVQGAHAGSEFNPGNGFDFWELVTVSKVSGEQHQVERIVIDDHFDSQRRRQHQSPSTKYSGTINHG